MPSGKNKPLVSIIIPAYNEVRSIAELATSIRRECIKSSVRFELIMIDDGSTDGTFSALIDIKKTFRSPMTIVKLRKRSGKSLALSEGFRVSGGELILTMDADLQDDPSQGIRLLKNLRDDVDMLVGWRKDRKDSSGKLKVSYIFNQAVSLFSGLHLHDMNCGLKVMRRSVMEEIPLYGELHRFMPVLAYGKGFRIAELSITHHRRRYGSSKFGFTRIFAAFDLMTTLFLSGFGTRPIMIFGPFGLMLVALGSLALVYLSMVHFSGQSIGTRPLLLLGVLSVLFGLQVLSTGLLGEMIVSISGAGKRGPVEKVVIS